MVPDLIYSLPLGTRTWLAGRSTNLLPLGVKEGGPPLGCLGLSHQQLGYLDLNHQLYLGEKIVSSISMYTGHIGAFRNWTLGRVHQLFLHKGLG